MHSDNVKGALRAIPSDIALGLPDHALDDLIRAIDKHGQEVWQQGYNDGVKEAGKAAARNHPTGAGL
uniref:Uncharacterized protein n=1 Tax=Dinoroseobacter phage vB_DshS_R26L TaxID=3161158 RepID=A0AAU7VGB7_9CAUD